MAWTTAAAIYFVMWWIALFLVLPWGVRNAEESGTAVAPGTDPGAPVLPHLRIKLLATTLLAGVAFALFYWAYGSGKVTLDDLASLWGLLPK